MVKVLEKENLNSSANFFVVSPIPKVEGSIGFIRMVWLAECVNKAKVWRKNHQSLWKGLLFPTQREKIWNFFTVLNDLFIYCIYTHNDKREKSLQLWGLNFLVLKWPKHCHIHSRDREVQFNEMNHYILRFFETFSLKAIEMQMINRKSGLPNHWGSWRQIFSLNLQTHGKKEKEGSRDARFCKLLLNVISGVQTVLQTQELVIQI